MRGVGTVSTGPDGLRPADQELRLSRKRISALVLGRKQNRRYCPSMKQLSLGPFQGREN
jgi:hypothetical protein